MIGENQITPTPPNLVTSLKKGFDAIANHIAVILFPVVVDIFIWLGPRLRLENLIDSILNRLTSPNGVPDQGITEIIQNGQEIWALFAEQFNLLSALRSYPVGVPSLMASLLSADTPLGKSNVWELESVGIVVLAWLMLSLVGLVLGTYYFSLVSQAALTRNVRWSQALFELPWTLAQVIFLTMFWVVLMFGISVPASCMISLGALGGLPIAQCALMLYAGLALWIILPLLFSPHGIFVNHGNVLASVKKSVFLTRFTLPTTGLFFLVVVLVSKGLDLLWRVPPQTSWLTMVGVAGHAFVTTGILAASFVYYRDASQWVEYLFQYARAPSSHEVKSESSDKK